jgi:outer-membrane receptor for ferric coprogen and ferric-rhodotorulic acid
VADPLKIIAGLRVSKFDTDYYYLYDSPPGGFQYDFDKTLPYAGVVFDITRDFSAFASFTEIFKPQNAKDVDNRFIDPVDGESFEAGLKGAHFGGRLNTALTLFNTRQNNVPGPMFNDDGSPVFLADGTQASEAIDGARTRGFEFEATGQIREGWNLSVGWTKFSLKAGEDEDVRSFIPRTLVRTFTTWDVPGLAQKLTLGGGVNWQSASHVEVGGPSGDLTTLRQGSVPLVSLMARYRLASNMTLQINGDNLLDRKYFVLDQYANTCFGPPLNVAASFNWSF